MLNTEEIKNTFIFHIPHSGTCIPDYRGYNMGLIDDEIKLLTDFNTDDIFYIKGIERLIFPFSRIFCDVERLPDDTEPMYAKGAGFYYTHTDDNKILRDEIPALKSAVYRDYYLPHHNKLEQMVENRLNSYGVANIVDCHSFPDKTFQRDFHQERDRPDICIGADDFHTPKHLTNSIQASCEKFGLSWKINYPYEGTVVPLKYSRLNSNVRSVMIEINRDLYIDNQIVNFKKIAFLNEFVNEVWGFG